jgi:HlyD family secretion protein
VQVKLGITDGVSTEVVEGLEAGMQVVTGVISGADGARPQSGNPFSGRSRRPF